MMPSENGDVSQSYEINAVLKLYTRNSSKWLCKMSSELDVRNFY